MVTVVIPTPSEDDELTLKCISSLYTNGSDLDIRPTIWDTSFAHTVNIGSKNAKEYIACVNNDTIAPLQWRQLLNHLEDPEVGIVCPKEGDVPGFDPAGAVVTGARGFFGGFWVMRTKDWERLGGFDEGFYPYYCEDTDLLYRIEQEKLRIVQCHRVIVKHLKSHTINEDPMKDTYMAQNVKLFQEKHGFDPISYQH